MIEFIRMGNQKTTEAPKQTDERGVTIKQFVSVMYKDRGENIF